MKSSELCKAVGLKSLAEMGELVNRSGESLARTFKTDRPLFELLLRGAVGKKLDRLLGS